MTAPTACVSCSADVEPVDGKTRRLCPVCAGRRNRWFIAGGLIAAVGGVAALVIAKTDFSKKPPAEPEAEPGAVVAGSGSAGPLDPSRDEDVTPTAVETEAIAKCDGERINNIVQAMIENDKFEGAVRGAQTYNAKCERNHMLDWKAFYAYEQLKKWPEAAAAATRLITDEPNDSDFWWWRGKARSFAGLHEAAIVDIRQSLADSDANSNGIQISHLERAAQGAKQPCEQAFGLRWLANVGVELRSAALRELDQIYLANECEKLDGRGSFTWSATGLAKAKFKGTIAGKATQFMLDRNLGTPLITAKLADELGLQRGAEVELLLPTGLGKGHLATADIVVGGARATAVPLAIVDKLPEGMDAVLGLGFLWRFEVKSDDGTTYKASAPAH